MSESLPPRSELLSWSSTYSLITIERILGRYNIKLSKEDLTKAVKNSQTIYYRLVEVPLNNVLNGIRLQQAKDYQIYAQKLFVDYLLSGETGKSEESPGSLTREDLEKERKMLLTMSEQFQQLEYRHEKLISDSQKLLIDDAANWLKFFKKLVKSVKSYLQTNGIYKETEQVEATLNALFIEHDMNDSDSLNQASKIWTLIEQRLGQVLSPDLREFLRKELNEVEQYVIKLTSTLEPYINEVNYLSAELKRWRSDFYNFIVHVNELIKLLPEYSFDPGQLQLNLEAIYFDSDI